MRKIQIDLDLVYKSYVNGESVTKLAKKYKVDRSSLTDKLRANYDFPLPQGKFKKIGLEDRDYVVDLYEQGLTLTALAEEFHVHHEAIRKILIKAGVKRRKTGPDSINTAKKGDEDEEVLLTQS